LVTLLNPFAGAVYKQIINKSQVSGRRWSGGLWEIEEFSHSMYYWSWGKNRLCWGDIL